ncbi:MAG: amidohydrolase [Tissierellia bacterium]|jgi:aminobenzoyl-glutamate utilization protein B|nr:amidohydrolase [Tissierellia bacterium]
MDKKELINYLESITDEVNQVNMTIWNNPEVSGEEKESANLYRKTLEDKGFKIVNTPGMDHAFYAEYGSGYPVIAILGEYDALPGLSQKLDTEYNPVENDACGHGCGHNMLGAAAFGAALAAKEFIEKTKTQGTIRFYGCPEEETLIGKGKMIKAGAFEGCDIALSWHPMAVNSAIKEAFLAMNTMKFRFHGISAHAAQSPESGRSALDAVELMNVGANYMREHVIDKARIHYTITNAGGAPNIVPAEAESWYYVRAPKRKDVEGISQRLYDIARGAGLMTGTSVEIINLGGCYELLPNDVLFDLTYKNMKEIEGPSYTDEEIQYAKDLQDTLDPKMVDLEKIKYLGSSDNDIAIFEGLVEKEDISKVSVTGSSDSGDVSWNMPMNLFLTSTFPLGVPNHSWQATSASGSSIGTKGMMYGAKIFTGMIYDILKDNTIADEAIKEFKMRTKNNEYTSPLD